MVVAARDTGIWPFTSSTDALVAYYSRTGTTQRVAEAVASRLDSPTVERIRPVTDRSYPEWLLRSCLPGSRVPIEPVERDPSSHDVVFLGTPKWTLSCPPVTEYLYRASFAGTRLGLFMTYGGFDEERYLRRLVDRLRAGGASVPATLRVERELVGSDRYEEGVARFREAVLDRA